MPLVPEAPGAAGHQASGHRTRTGSSRLQLPARFGPVLPPSLSAVSLPELEAISAGGDRPAALTGQALATCPLGAWGGGAGWGSPRALVSLIIP